MIKLLATWAFNTGAGVFRVRSPRMHDNVQGLRQRVDAADPRPILPRQSFAQRFYPQDTLTAELSGSATAGKIEQASMLVYYGDLGGINGRFITDGQVAQSGVNIIGQETQHSPGSSGGYSGQVAINANFDNFKANVDYAIVGYRVDANCCTVRIQGADLGNLGLGGPGPAACPEVTSEWFLKLSAWYGLPLVPVVNAANKGGILVDVAQNEAGGAVNITWFLVELASGALR
jgi:hypothetical protein